MDEGEQVLTRAADWQGAIEARDAEADSAAVLTSATQQDTVLGHARSGRFILSTTWLRDDAGSWRVWRCHPTPVSAGLMPRA